MHFWERNNFTWFTSTWEDLKDKNDVILYSEKAFRFELRTSKYDDVLFSPSYEYKKRDFYEDVCTIFKSDIINNMDHMRISDTNLSSSTMQDYVSTIMVVS